MPTLVPFLRRVLQLSAAALLIGILISCASKKEKSPSHRSSPAVAGKKMAGPVGSPTPSPAPAPTPQMTYIATAKVDGVDVTQGTPSPSPTGSPTPSPSPNPTPKPKPTSSNFITGAWRKIFPPKPTPAPTPGENDKLSIHVSTSDSGDADQAMNATGPGSIVNAVPSPTPIQIKLRPSEGFLTRMWHKVFPKKKEPPVAAPPQWVGTIKLINDRENYALIDSPTSFSAPTGETLNSVGGDAESGVLRVTADRNPPFFIADIVSGKPQAGDRVYSPKP